MSRPKSIAAENSQNRSSKSVADAIKQIDDQSKKCKEIILYFNQKFRISNKLLQSEVASFVLQTQLDLAQISHLSFSLFNNEEACKIFIRTLILDNILSRIPAIEISPTLFSSPVARVLSDIITTFVNDDFAEEIILCAKKGGVKIDEKDTIKIREARLASQYKVLHATLEKNNGEVFVPQEIVYIRQEELQKLQNGFVNSSQNFKPIANAVENFFPMANLSQYLQELPEIAAIQQPLDSAIYKRAEGIFAEIITNNQDVINLTEKEKLTKFFGENKNLLAHLFQTSDGVEKFIICLHSLQDGCAANIGAQISIALYQALIVEPKDQALYKYFIENIYRPIVGFGGDIIYTNPNPLTNAVVNQAAIAPVGFISGFKKEFLPQNLSFKAWDILHSELGEEQKIILSELFTEKNLSPNIQDEISAELCVYLILQRSLPQFLENNQAKSFVENCQSILHEVLEKQAMQNAETPLTSIESASAEVLARISKIFQPSFS